jgi:sugar/nucleoside kinase (ribokinase family)
MTHQSESSAGTAKRQTRNGPDDGSGRAFDILVVGEILADVIVRAADPRPAFGQAERYVDSVDLVMGSSSVIFACGAARLGLRVAVAGLAGDDTLGRFMIAAMAERGLDISAVRLDPERPTGASVHLVAPADRAILTAPGTTPFMRVDDVPTRLLRSARHVHAGAVYVMDGLRPDLPALFQTARDGGATTSLDTNWDPTGSWEGGVGRILPVTDVFLPNEVEATRIARQSDPEAAARALVAMGARVVAVKLGSAGAIALAGGRLARCRAPRVEPADTTGAGDSFDAGFIAAWLAGRPLEECLAIAVACGSLSTRGIGGTAGQPTLDEAEALARATGLLS